MKQMTLLFLLKDTQILLAMKKRGFGKERWNGVGGKVEENETIAEAAIRECFEEIDVTVSNITKVAELSFYEKYDDTSTNILVHAFISREWIGTPTETEEMSPSWFEVTDIPYSEMWPDDQYWLPKVLQGQKISGQFTLDNNDKIVHQKVKVVEAF